MYGMVIRQKSAPMKKLELLARGDYPREGLLSHIFPLGEYRQAFQTAFNKRRFESVKVALDLRTK
jgi:threonine dehydrogenase-like Zn-dependent dehydrogenase